MTTLFYEDFTPGWMATFGPLKVTQDDIIRFASEYDAQPFHTDPEQAKHTFPGRLIASGWHSCALVNKLLAENFLLRIAGQGSPGIDETRWIVPLFPDDEISLELTITEARPLQSRPQLGMLGMTLKLLKQDGTLSTAIRGPVFIRRRHPGTDSMEARQEPERNGERKAMPPMAEPPASLLFVEEMHPGLTTELGSHTFEADEIVRFARQFDPQYFHIDAEAAKDSLFGGLCASGWHTTANWMRVTSTLFKTASARMQAEGRPIPQLGPSPGFSGLKWFKPVFAGDTIRYRNEVISTRSSASRPGWGLIFHRNTGDNQHGERVLEFSSSVLRQMRPG